MKPIVKQTLLWVVVIGALLWVRSNVVTSGPKELTPSFTEVMTKAEAGQVKDVTIEGATMAGHFAGGERFRTAIPGHQPAMFTTFRDHGINVTVREQNSNVWLNTAISVVPFLLLLAMPLTVLALLLYVVRRRRTALPAGA
jgi:cell division protease FtsH